MEIQEIIDYIEKTPANTNPNVLSTMLAELGGGGGGSATYTHSIEMKAGDGEGSEVGAKGFDFTFVVPSHDSTPVTTLEGIMSILSDYGEVVADGDYTAMTGQGPQWQVIVQLVSDGEGLFGTFAYYKNSGSGEELTSVGTEDITSLWGIAYDLTITDTVTEF